MTSTFKKQVYPSEASKQSRASLWGHAKNHLSPGARLVFSLHDRRPATHVIVYNENITELLSKCDIPVTLCYMVIFSLDSLYDRGYIFTVIDYGLFVIVFADRLNMPVTKGETSW